MMHRSRSLPRRDGLAAAERRLLRALAADTGQPGGSLAGRGLPQGPRARAAQVLVRLGLAVWSGEGDDATLRITEDGRLRAVRAFFGELAAR